MPNDGDAPPHGHLDAEGWLISNPRMKEKSMAGTLQDKLWELVESEALEEDLRIHKMKNSKMAAIEYGDGTVAFVADLEGAAREIEQRNAKWLAEYGPESWSR
jgi:hypothetical protein